MAGESQFYVGPELTPDKYRLKRQVGSGGEAQLWEAELHVSGSWEPVAVKVLRADRFADLDRWKARWAEQAEVLRFIRHPGVVGVREHFEGGGMHYAGEQPTGQRALYLTMNWVDGRTLREWTQLHRSPADGYEALRYLAQVGDVLDWLHSGQATPSGRPVIHADVTPNNVIVTPAGQAVLVDFGLTRLAAGISQVVEGTGGYVAPEIKAAGAYSPGSDRYAFGALTYFVLTGTPASASLAEIRAGLGSVPSVAAQPGALEHLMRMFDPNPLARPGCGEWIRSFKITGATSADPGGVGFTAPLSPVTVAQPTMPLPVSVPPPPPAEKSGQRRKRLVAAILVLGLLIAAGVAFAATRTSDDNKAIAAPTSSAPSVVDTTVATNATVAATSPATTPATAVTTTTKAAPRSTTTFTSPPQPVPPDAYVYTGAVYCNYFPVNVTNTPTPAASCQFGGAAGIEQKTIDVNISPRAKRFTARLVLSDDSSPVDAVALFSILVDGIPLTDGSITFAKPYVIDIDVTDKRRVTLNLNIRVDSKDVFRVVITEPFFVN